MGAQSRQSDDLILHAARTRREEVERILGELRPNVLTNPAAAEQYEALIHERGQLDTVLARR